MNPQPIPRVLKEPICFTFADVVRVHREARGWEPNELGIFTKLSGQMIKYIEAHGRVPTIDVGARISRAFEVPFSLLIIEAERRLQL